MAAFSNMERHGRARSGEPSDVGGPEINEVLEVQLSMADSVVHARTESVKIRFKKMGFNVSV